MNKCQTIGCPYPAYGTDPFCAGCLQYMPPTTVATGIPVAEAAPTVSGCCAPRQTDMGKNCDAPTVSGQIYCSEHLLECAPHVATQAALDLANYRLNRIDARLAALGAKQDILTDLLGRLATLLEKDRT